MLSGSGLTTRLTGVALLVDARSGGPLSEAESALPRSAATKSEPNPLSERQQAGLRVVEKVPDDLRTLQEQRHHSPGRAVPDTEEDYFGRPTVKDTELEKVFVTREEH